MAFEERVPFSVFGLPGDGDTLAAVAVVAMGWTPSVDIVHVCSTSVCI